MVSILNAYGDESGIQSGSPYCLIMGYIAGLDTWKLFSRDWSTLLREFSLTEFHAQRFFTSPKQSGEYANWPITKRRKFIADLLSIIEVYQPTVIGHAVDVNAFLELSHNERRFLSGGLINLKTGKWATSGKQSDPYSLAFALFIGNALRVASNDTVVNFVFDNQDVSGGYAKQMFKEMKSVAHIPGCEKMGDVSYSDSVSEPALQAADLLAYIWYSWLTRREAISKEVRLVMSVISRGRNHIGILDGNEMQQRLVTFRNRLQSIR